MSSGFKALGEYFTRRKLKQFDITNFFLMLLLTLDYVKDGSTANVRLFHILQSKSLGILQQ
jgi:hypothetical protein